MSKAKDFLEVISEGLSTADMHKLKEARESLAKSCAGVKLSGVINHSEAKRIIEQLTGNKTERAGCACGKKNEDITIGSKDKHSWAAGDDPNSDIPVDVRDKDPNCVSCGKTVSLGQVVTDATGNPFCSDACKNGSPKKDESASERVARMLAGAEAKTDEDLQTAKITYTDGSSYTTSVSAEATQDSLEKYFKQDGGVHTDEDSETGKETSKTVASVELVKEEAGDDLLAAAALLISAANDVTEPTAPVVTVPAELKEWEKMSVNKSTITQDVNGHDVHTGSSNDIDNGKSWSTTVFWNGTEDQQVGPDFNSEAEAMKHHQEVVDGIKAGSLKPENNEQAPPARKFTFEDLKGFKNLKKEQPTNESNSDGTDRSYMQRMFGG